MTRTPWRTARVGASVLDRPRAQNSSKSAGRTWGSSRGACKESTPTQIGVLSRVRRRKRQFVGLRLRSCVAAQCARNVLRSMVLASFSKAGPRLYTVHRRSSSRRSSTRHVTRWSRLIEPRRSKRSTAKLYLQRRTCPRIEGRLVAFCFDRRSSRACTPVVGEACCHERRGGRHEQLFDHVRAAFVLGRSRL